MQKFLIITHPLLPKKIKNYLNQKVFQTQIEKLISLLKKFFSIITGKKPIKFYKQNNFIPALKI